MPLSTPDTSHVLRRAVGTGPDTFARVSARAGALRRLGLDSVLAPLRVAMEADGTVVVELPRVDGTDLAEIARGRPPLSAGECAWLGAQVAAALEAMHGAGLAHGDVSPANVLVRAGGITLVDTLSGCLEDERGTLGFQAPERARGATVPGDICSLGLLLRWSADAACRVPLEEWTAPMVLPDAAARPSAAVVSAALSQSARQVPVIVPRTDVIAATRARIVERTQRVDSAAPTRGRLVGVRAGIVAGVLALAGTVVLAIPPLVDAALAGEHGQAAASRAPTGKPAAQEDAAPAHAGGTPEQPAEAAARLTHDRVAALAGGDAEALRALAAPGHLASELDELAQRLESGGLRYEGVGATVLDTHVIEATENRAEVVVDYRVGEHTVVDAGVATPVDAFDQSVRMVLVRTAPSTGGAQWRVESVTTSG